MTNIFYKFACIILYLFLKYNIEYSFCCKNLLFIKERMVKMTEFPIGLQLYSVRDEMEKDFEGTIAKVAKMGYQGVEFAGTFGRTAEQVAKTCREAGVIPVSAHVPFDDMRKDPEGVVEYYANIGVRCIVVPWLGREYLPGSEGYETFKATVTKIAETAKKCEIKICYHNHDFEFEKLNGEYLLDIIYKDLPCLYTQVDTCWANVGMGDPVGYLKKYKDRAPTVHLKDYAGEKSDNMYALIGKDDVNDTSEQKQAFEFRPVGYGKQDFVSILAAAKEINSGWVIVEQDNASMGKTALECAEMSINYLKSL